MFSDEVEKYIQVAIERIDLSMGGPDEQNQFEKLLSMGELIDRLTIVNKKLWTEKEVQFNLDVHYHTEELALSAENDVRLCKERARLKACIDEKLIAIITRIVYGEDAGFNKEVKNY